MRRKILHRDYVARLVLNMANIVSWLVIGFIILCLTYIFALKFKLISPAHIQAQEVIDPVKPTCLTD